MVRVYGAICGRQQMLLNTLGRSLKCFNICNDQKSEPIQYHKLVIHELRVYLPALSLLIVQSASQVFSNLIVHPSHLHMIEIKSEQDDQLVK